MKAKIIYSLAIISLIVVSFVIPKNIQAQTATLSLVPTSGSYNVGDTFNVEIRLNTDGATVIGTNTYINFDSQLSIPSGQIDVAGSAFGMVVTNTVAGNQIRIEAIDINGVSGANLLVGTISFRADSSGTANVTFDGSCQVSEDLGGGNVSDILGATTDGAYAITMLTTATLALNPASGSYQAGQNFTVDIEINTGGQATDGADVHYLNYNPLLLEAQSVSPGSLYPNTDVSQIDNANGRIDFSQTTTGGTTYTGSGTLATINFKALAQGTANVTFNFTPGLTTDCNVSKAGGGHEDILSSVTNGSYTLTAAPPTQDTTPPAAITNLEAKNPTQTSIELSWTAPGDDGNTGTAASYDIRYRTSNITETQWGGTTQATGEPTPASAGTSQSTTVTGLSQNTNYFFAIKTVDNEGNISDLSNVAQKKTLREKGLRVKIKPEGKTNLGNISVWTTIYRSGTNNAVLEDDPDTTDSAGNCLNLDKLTDFEEDNWDIKVRIRYHLTKKITNVSLSATQIETVIEIELLAGNLQDNDNAINELDWSIMASQWHTADAVADINDDGDVNTLDWHYLNKNWGLVGD